MQDHNEMAREAIERAKGNIVLSIPLQKRWIFMELLLQQGDFMEPCILKTQ